MKFYIKHYHAKLDGKQTVIFKDFDNEDRIIVVPIFNYGSKQKKKSYLYSMVKSTVDINHDNKDMFVHVIEDDNNMLASMMCDFQEGLLPDNIEVDFLENDELDGEVVNQ